MDILLFSAKCVLPLVIMMAVGYLLNVLKILKDSFVQEANRFVFKLLLPLQLFRNIASQTIETVNWGLMGYAAGMIVLVCVLLCLIVPRVEKSKPTAGAMIQGIFRSNFVIFGLPLAINMFGEAGSLPTALLLPVATPIFNILAVLVLSYYGSSDRKPGVKSLLISIIKNPLIIASVLGIVMALLPFDIPEILDKPLNQIGAAATPFSLIMLGAGFEFSKLKGRKLTKAAVCTVLRLIALPAFAVGLAILIGFRGSELGAIFILFSAPTAVSSYVMAQNMGADSELAGQLVVLTTLFSCVTIFGMTALLRAFAFI